MKRIFASASVCITLLLTWSCSREMTTSTYTLDEFFSPIEESPDSLHIQMDIEYASGNLKETVMDNLNQVIADILDTVGRHECVQDAAEALKDNIVADYLSSRDWEEEAEDIWRPNLTYYSYTGYFGGRHGKMQTYILEEENYTGGAHGMYSESAFLIDLRTGFLVREDEFFADGYREALSDLLTEHIYNLPEEDENFEGVNIDDIIFVDEIVPNGNFKVDEQGLTYIFNPYEIGPYVLGIVHIILPWREVEPLLRK